MFWTPAFAGVTAKKAFYELVKHYTFRILLAVDR
jgi:hypothetical protein